MGATLTAVGGLTTFSALGHDVVCSPGISYLSPSPGTEGDGAEFFPVSLTLDFKIEP